MTYIVIMAGGSGTRFWPKSRKNIPKQCISITSEKPMIQETVERLERLTERKNIYIATGSNLEKPIKKILPDINFVIEPCAKNTAACIGLSAIAIAKKDPEAVMVIETADHTYSDVDSYIANLSEGVEMAKENKIVLIGIKPTFPHTGYGYIHQGELIKENEIKIYEIAEFKEKPDLKTAKEFLENGNYLWNSGIFISKVNIMLNAIQRYMPNLYRSLINISNSNFNQEVLEKEFNNLESISIDYGVMERATNTVVLRGEFPWDDVGDWKAMERIYPKDEKGNIVLADHRGDARNCIIIGNGKPIETGDIEDLIIIDTKDCLLVCDKDRCQEVKKIIEILENDPKLKKYAEDIQNEAEFHQISLSCEDLEVQGKGVIATIGVDNLYIEKNESIILREVE
jgi:mannose-1-phosphate guanylyltransferase